MIVSLVSLNTRRLDEAKGDTIDVYGIFDDITGGAVMSLTMALFFI